MIILHTTKGPITIELDHERAPATAKNFAEYVENGFYAGTLFHRVIPGFVIQGGGMESGMSEKRTAAPIKNEGENGLQNLRGTLSMARTSDPHSATSQFFINLTDNASLDHTAPTPSGWGYCVFAEVTEGMDVVDSIAAAATTSHGMHQDVPQEEISIEKVEIRES